MKQIFLILVFLECLSSLLVYGQTIQPIERSVGKLQFSIDPRMEILSAVQLLANYPVVNKDLPYSKEIVNYFESFASHEAVVMTESLLQKHGFSYGDPVIFMLHLSQFPELEMHIAFTDYLKMRSGGGDNLEQYRKSIKLFAGISHFETFWNTKMQFYNNILDLTIANIGKIDLTMVNMGEMVLDVDMIKVLEDYFNETHENFNIIISPSFRGGYGPKITDDDGNDKIYACLSTTDMKEDIPYLNGMRLLFYVWHEFGHSYVNPVTDKYSDRVESLNQLFDPIKEDMSKMAYGDWKTCVNEHVIRAVNIRLYELFLGSQISQLMLKDELRQRYIYIEPLIEKLKEFEIKRDKNNVTFTEYYPELLNMLESLQK